jgi:hypothetical protein
MSVELSIGRSLFTIRLLWWVSGVDPGAAKPIVSAIHKLRAGQDRRTGAEIRPPAGDGDAQPSELLVVATLELHYR